jgi:hypothetical protein
MTFFEGLQENVKTIVERIQPNFEYPVKMSVYEPDLREPESVWFGPPRTINVYEDIDESKKIEQQIEHPDPLEPRYMKLKTEKNVAENEATTKRVKKEHRKKIWIALLKALLVFGMPWMCIAIVAFGIALGLDNAIELAVILLPCGLAWVLMFYIFVYQMSAEAEKEKEKKLRIEKRLLCAFREGNEIKVLIINDVKKDMENSIQHVLYNYNLQVTYQDREKVEATAPLGKEQPPRPRSFEDIINDEGM